MSKRSNKVFLSFDHEVKYWLDLIDQSRQFMRVYRGKTDQVSQDKFLYHEKCYESRYEKLTRAVAEASEFERNAFIRKYSSRALNIISIKLLDKEPKVHKLEKATFDSFKTQFRAIVAQVQDQRNKQQKIVGDKKKFIIDSLIKIAGHAFRPPFDPNTISSGFSRML